MRLFTRFIFSILVSGLLICSHSISAQSDFSPLEKLEIPGQPYFPVVEQIYQDSRGFMWFGTYGGLYMYDGYSLTHFQNGVNDTLSISDNKVNVVFEDEKGDLWIGMQDGLNRLIVSKRKFERFSSEQWKLEGNPDVYCIQQDKWGNLWLGTSHGLFKKDLSSNLFVEFPFYPDKNQDRKLSSKTVFEFLIDEEENFWIGTHNGLVKANFNKNVFQIFFPNKKYNWASNYIRTLRYDTLEEKIWVGTRKGIFLFLPDQLTFIQKPEFGPFINSSTVKDIIISPPNRIILNSGEGIFGYNLSNNSLEEIYSPPDNLHGNNNLNFWNLHVSNSQKLWTYYHLDNIYTFDFRKQRFHHIPFFPLQKITGVDGLFELYEYRPGELLLPDQPLPILYNWKNGTKKPFLYTPKYNLQGWQSGMTCFFEEEGGWLWIGTISGLFLFDKKNNKFLPIGSNIKGIELLDNATIRKIHKDQADNLWVGTWYTGIYKINFNTKQLSRYFKPYKNMPAYFSSIRTIYEDRSHNIWIGSRRGLHKYLPEKDDFESYYHDPDDPQSLSDNTAFCIYEDKEGYIWVGTYGGGLNRLDPKTGKFIHYTTDDGLLNNNVFSLIPDEKNNLWILSYDGVTRFNLQDKTFKNFTHSDGLINEGFEGFLYGKSPYTGELFFGGREGIDIFHPDSIYPSTFQPNVVLTDLRLFNKSVSVNREGIKFRKDSFLLDKHITFTDTLKLAYNQKVITFEFAALNYADPLKIQYAYQLENFDTEWQYVGNTRTATYTNLDPDRYVFRVKATNVDGIWSNKQAKLHLLISPPWWQTTWAILLYILSGILIATMILWEQRRRLLVRAKLKYEQQEKIRLKEIDQLKTTFYQNISHELRTPLTVILGLTDEIRNNFQKLGKNRIVSYLQSITRNGNSLLKLVNQMLDLSKIDARKFQLNLKQGDLIAFTKYFLESYESFAESKGVQLNLITDLDSLIMDFDSERMQQVLNNLLSNAFKYTPPGKSIELHISIIHSPKDLNFNTQKCLCLVVSDKGKGITKEDLPFVFDRFYKSSEGQLTEGSSGIGLALTKELIHLMKGTITVNSSPGEGTTFEIRLPITQNAPLDQKKDNQFKHFLSTPVAREVEENQTIHTANDKLKILIIEDNLDVRNYLKMCLSSNYRILEAENGAIGIEKAIDEIPDMIICDVMMPEKNGFEVCEILTSQDSTNHIPIILLTAKADLASKLEGLSLGAVDYLPKPFNKEELLFRIRSLTDFRSNIQKRYQSLSALPEPQNPLEKIQDSFVLKVKKKIEDSLGQENFGPQELADAVFLSKTQLHRKLKALTGKPTGKFIHFVKLFYAKKLLKEMDMSVSQVAHAVGYKEHSYFSKLFSEEFGYPPSKLHT